MAQHIASFFLLAWLLKLCIFMFSLYRIYKKTLLKSTFPPQISSTYWAMGYVKPHIFFIIFKVLPGPELTHWGQVTHICIGKLTIIGSDNGLSPWRRQAIIWTSAGILLIGPFITNFNEILIGIQTFSFKKMHLKVSSAKLRPFCLGLNVSKWFIVIRYCMQQQRNKVLIE